jgi:hypothetical protein
MGQKYDKIEILLQKILIRKQEMAQATNHLLSYQEIKNIVYRLPPLDQETEYNYENEKILDIKGLLSDLITHFFVPVSVAVVFIIVLLNYIYNTSPKNIEVTFKITNPQAKVVQIAGDFTKWEPVLLTKKNGFWEINLKLKPGEYKYIYLIDGQPYIDPQKDVYEDPFGTKNSVIYI